MLLLSTGKRRQRKHFKKLKLHAGKQDRKEEEEGREEAFSTRVACRAQKKRRGRDRGKQVKIKEYILIILGLFTSC